MYLTDIGIMKGLRWKNALLKLNFRTECGIIWLYTRDGWQDITRKYWSAESQKVSSTFRLIHNSDIHFWKRQSMWFRQRDNQPQIAKSPPLTRDAQLQLARMVLVLQNTREWIQHQAHMQSKYILLAWLYRATTTCIFFSLCCICGCILPFQALKNTK